MKRESKHGAHDAIVIGGSSGAIEALKVILRDLSPDLPVTVFIVLHVAPFSPRLMPGIITRESPWQASYATDGEKIQRGHVYVAPPDLHMTLERKRIRVRFGPKENRHRPAIDPLFRSAARHMGKRVIGVLLSGNLDDGTAGLQAIHQAGGVTVIQDPRDALYPAMVQNAQNKVKIDYTEPLIRLASRLKDVVFNGRQTTVRSRPNRIDDGVLRGEVNSMEILNKLGRPSTFICPDCNGALWELNEAGIIQYRCHTGHCFSDENLVVAKSDEMEKALWAAVRSLNEKAELLDRILSRSKKPYFSKDASELKKEAREAQENARRVRDILLGPPSRD